ncbi:MAG: hypothetical protein D4R65_12555 [Verrucomicrobiaceae bacterium]|nr:MAG: hypothetical protein D4R65_12555 [Verrucomicrobiaceae bacterium]
MLSPTSPAQINLRQRKTLPGKTVPEPETTVTLAGKLDELFKAGYEQDEIYGLVIPLLMQGKVRIDLEERSERLELEDQDLRFPRSEAVKVFEDFRAVRRAS